MSLIDKEDRNAVKTYKVPFAPEFKQRALCCRRTGTNCPPLLDTVVLEATDMATNVYADNRCELKHN